MLASSSSGSIEIVSLYSFNKLNVGNLKLPSSKVGSNSVVIKDVEANRSVVGNPARYTISNDKISNEFSAYGLSGEDDSRTARVRKLEDDNKLLLERLIKIEKLLVKKK